MPKNKAMPLAPMAQRSDRVHSDLSIRAMELWNPGIMAAENKDNVIGVYDVIGDYWGEGVTASRISAALRSIGADKPVTVNINSPGGDLFEGLAIYNLLREHKGEVTVKVLSLAASAASIIAMAGDNVEVARAGFFMIHNAWVLAVGNRHDLVEISEYLEPFDRAMGGIYEARTGMSESDVAEMMDKESWLGGKDSIAQGLADEYLPADQLEEDAKAHAPRIAAHKMDLALAKSGMPRSERRKLMSTVKTGTQNATEDTHNAVIDGYEPLGLKVELKLNI